MDETLSLRKRIEEAAASLGANAWTIYKWRERGIPAEWRLRLITETNFTLEEIERAQELGTRGRTQSSEAAE